VQRNPKARRRRALKLNSAVSADANGGRAHWEAHYLFSATGRQVHNIIDGTFRLVAATCFRSTNVCYY
jgi:hypothetical protein